MQKESHFERLCNIEYQIKKILIDLAVVKIPYQVECLVVFYLLKASCVVLLFVQYKCAPITKQYMYKTKYALLHRSRTYTKAMYTLVSDVLILKGNLNRTAFIKSRAAQSKQHRTTNLKIVSSSPTMEKNFSFRICRFRHAPGRSTGPIQMKSSMPSVRGI